MSVLLLLFLIAVIVAVAGVGAVSWRAMKAAAAPKQVGKRIDPFTLSEPWRFFVRDAKQAQARFAETLRRATDGPIKDRLEDIGRRIDETVEQCWQTAQQAQSVRDARRRIDVSKVEARLAESREAAEIADFGDDTSERTIRALESQLDSAERLDGVIAQAEARLKLLDAQLDEAVARAAELSVQAGGVNELERVSDEIDNVVEEMEALRQALEETGGTSSFGTA